MEEEQVKTTFRDLKGREWNLRVTVQRAMDLREKMAFDIELFADPNHGLMQKMVDDSWLLIDALLIMTADERAEKKIDNKDFLDAIDGPVLDEALTAFLNGIAVSLKKLKRRALLAAVRQVDHGMEMAATRMEARIDKNLPAMERQIDSAIGNLSFEQQE